MHYAVDPDDEGEGPCEEMVGLLLKAGADTSIENRLGRGIARWMRLMRRLITMWSIRRMCCLLQRWGLRMMSKVI